MPQTHRPEPRYIWLAANRVEGLMVEGPYDGWIVFKHPDGQWVTERKATEDEILKITAS